MCTFWKFILWSIGIVPWCPMTSDDTWRLKEHIADDVWWYLVFGHDVWWYPMVLSHLMKLHAWYRILFDGTWWSLIMSRLPVCDSIGRCMFAEMTWKQVYKLLFRATHAAISPCQTNNSSLAEKSMIHVAVGKQHVCNSMVCSMHRSFFVLYRFFLQSTLTNAKHCASINKTICFSSKFVSPWGQSNFASSAESASMSSCTLMKILK